MALLAGGRNCEPQSLVGEGRLSECALLYHDVSLRYVSDGAASAHKNKVSDHGVESLKPCFTYVMAQYFCHSGGGQGLVEGRNLLTFLLKGERRSAQIVTWLSVSR